METLALTIFLVYYLSIVLTETDGPLGVLYKLRNKNFGPLSCLTCIAFWVALVASLIIFDHNQLLYALGISGIVIFIDRMVNG